MKEFTKSVSRSKERVSDASGHQIIPAQQLVDAEDGMV